MKSKVQRIFVIMLLLTICTLIPLNGQETNLISDREAEAYINFVMTDYPYVVTGFSNSKAQVRQLRRDQRKARRQAWIDGFQTGGCIGGGVGGILVSVIVWLTGINSN